MTANARVLAVRLPILRVAPEAKVHGTDLSHVHFHEVGAIDSIVDILSVAVCADSLGIENVILPALSEGQGMIRCQHGLMPIPVPAVAAVAQTYGLPLRYTGVQGELVTPTGAAIAACFSDRRKTSGFVSDRALRYRRRQAGIRTSGYLADHGGKSSRGYKGYRLEAGIGYWTTAAAKHWRIVWIACLKQGQGKRIIFQSLRRKTVRPISCRLSVRTI